MKLTVATCQFDVSADVARNLRFVLRQMRAAKKRGAHVAHFCEGSLSGYAGVDFARFDGFDWEELEAATREVLDLARELRLFVLLGSSHRLSGRRKPHNSVYVIDDRGRIQDRYDKLFCAGDRKGTSGDLSHYSPGDHFAVFEIRGIRCGVLICHDYRYPELYREYKKRGVQVMFHSYHAGNVSPARVRAIEQAIGPENLPYNHGRTYPEITMPASMQAAAASSHVWISCPNSSARESCFGSFFVRADGVITGRLPRHRPGILLSTVDTRAPLYDSTVVWRENAMKGVFHSGRAPGDLRSRDPRSRNRKAL
ncbi:MAG: carbon-nitrogen hydrolase family protein [Myxococcota bacterium]|nr:carbon-nitrogen hydrolase family protein [Myxococcota bacterium]